MTKLTITVTEEDLQAAKAARQAYIDGKNTDIYWHSRCCVISQAVNRQYSGAEASVGFIYVKVFGKHYRLSEIARKLRMDYDNDDPITNLPLTFEVTSDD